MTKMTAVLRACALPLGIATCLFAAACAPPAQDDTPTRFAFTALETARIPTPEGAPKDSCWARDVAPAVIETKTAQVMVQPAILNDDGSLLAPAVYATETLQDIVTPRREYVFETLCAKDITPEFIASLQRALQVRSRYNGEISGEINPETEAALRLFQQDQEVETSLLTIETARALGLVAVERDMGQNRG